MKKVLEIFAIALLGGLVALGINQLFVKYSESGNFETMQKKNAKFATIIDGSGSAPSFDFVRVSEISTPAVVHIKSHFAGTQSGSKGSPEMIDPFEFFKDKGFEFEVPRGPGIASGSGVVIAQDGYIFTNNHVIENADKIEVTLNDKRTFIAELIGTDKTTDLALLKIEEKNF